MPKTVGKPQTVEFDWHGPVAADIADAIGERLVEDDAPPIWSVTASKEYDGTAVILNHLPVHDVLAAVHDALVEHADHPETDYELPDEFDVTEAQVFTNDEAWATIRPLDTA